MRLNISRIMRPFPRHEYQVSIVEPENKGTSWSMTTPDTTLLSTFEIVSAFARERKPAKPKTDKANFFNIDLLTVFMFDYFNR